MLVFNCKITTISPPANYPNHRTINPDYGKDHAASHPSALWLEGDKDGSTVAFSQNSRGRKLTFWGVAGYVVVYFLPKRQ